MFTLRQDRVDVYLEKDKIALMFTLRKTDFLKIKQKNGVHIGTVFILYKLIKP